MEPKSGPAKSTVWFDGRSRRWVCDWWGGTDSFLKWESAMNVANYTAARWQQERGQSREGA